MSKEQLIKEAKEAIINYDEEAAKAVAQKAIAEGIDLVELINEGYTAGMAQIGEMFANEEIPLPIVMVAADAMQAAIDILEPHIPKQTTEKRGVVVIGTIEGDIHDIGKNIVATMLKVSGFEVHNLGRDVPPKVFVEKAKELNADIICTSTLMTTTMIGQKLVEEELRKAGLRDRIKTMVGGAPVNQNWADKIGADAYGPDANAAVRLARELLQK